MRAIYALVLLGPFVLTACSSSDTGTPSNAQDAGTTDSAPAADAPPDGAADTATVARDSGANDAAPADAGADAADAPSEASDAPTEGGEGGDGAAQGGVAVSNDARNLFESEDQIAVASDGTIGIAWTAFRTTSPEILLGYRFSTDGGASFSAIGYLTMPAGLIAGDPAITADAMGNFYISTLGMHVTGQNLDYTRVYVAKAAAGTTTFDAPVEVSDPMTTVFHDHPKTFVTADGTIVTSFMESQTISSSSTTGITASSKDGGQTWTRSFIVDAAANEFANLFWFCEGQGILYSTYLEAPPTGYYVALRSSTDDGATWSTTSTVISLGSETPAGLDPTCVANGNDVWVAYGTTPSPVTSQNDLDPAHALRVAHSSDRGASVGATRMDALDTAAGSLGLIPLMTRETGGALDIAYLTGNADGDTMGSMRYVRASGATFGSSVVVDGPLLFTINRAADTWVGDYLGSVVHGTGLYLAYPMNAQGVTHIYFRRMALP